jgi:hypothetical protein
MFSSIHKIFLLTSRRDFVAHPSAGFRETVRQRERDGGKERGEHHL